MKKLKKGLVALLACLMLLGGPAIDSSAACNHGGKVYVTITSSKKVIEKCSKHNALCTFEVTRYAVNCSNCGGYIESITRKVHK